MLQVGNEGKLYIFMKKIFKNEKCADFYADIGGPVSKNMIFYRSIRAGSGPVPIAPAGTHSPGLAKS